MVDSQGDDEELTTEDILDATVASRRVSPNVSYFAFTATPKIKPCNYLAGCQILPKLHLKPICPPLSCLQYAPSDEEGFILDVLKNYTNYKVAYNLALKNSECRQGSGK